VAVSRELAAQASAKLEEDPVLSLSLLKTATGLAQTEQMPTVLMQWARSPLRAVMRGHTNWVGTAEFSPDGRRVVTASDDSTARVWDSATGTLIAELKGHSDSLNTAKPIGRTNALREGREG
jgi:WD40 repeat protein